MKRAIKKSCSCCEHFVWRRRPEGTWGACEISGRHLPNGIDLTKMACRSWKRKEIN